MCFLCRILGSLLSTHLIITDREQPFGDLMPKDYNDELLGLANDIASRLLPAFENTATGIPFPRVNLSLIKDLVFHSWFKSLLEDV